MPVPALHDLKTIFGDIDIYLFDQLLKGRITEGMQVLDAGCGNGRNMQYLMQAGIEVYGADKNAAAILQAKEVARTFNPKLPEQNFVVADLSNLPFKNKMFDVVICSAVLHFATDEHHFRSIILELWRVLKPGGMLFCRFSTTIGLEGKLLKVGDRKFQMAHGPVWFLADEALLQELEIALYANRLEPLKTVVVEQERSMTTWVLLK